VVELPFYGFVGEEIWVPRDCSLLLRNTLLSLCTSPNTLATGLVVFSFLLFHDVSLGCFVFTPCLSSHPSSSFRKPCGYPETDAYLIRGVDALVAAARS